MHKNLSSFLPLNSKSQITKLVAYLKECNQSNRFDIRECTNEISTNNLREVFFKKCLQQNLYPRDEKYIQSTIKTMNTEVSFHKEKTPGTKTKEERKIRPRIINSKHTSKSNVTIKAKELAITDHKIQSKNLSCKSIQSTQSSEQPKRCKVTIKAKELVISEQTLSFGEYSYRSNRIPVISQNSLSKIKHKFPILIDKTSKTFTFHHLSDLDKLLKEAQKRQNSIQKVMLSKIKKEKSTKVTLKKNNTRPFELPWEYVTFFDGGMYLRHPNPTKRGTFNPFCFRHVKIKKAFQHIMPYIEQRCPKFLVTAKDGVIIGVSNFTQFIKMIHFINSELSDSEINVNPYFKSNNTKLSYTQFQQKVLKYKSRYLKFLSTVQLPDKAIFYLHERAIYAHSERDTDEYGFLLTIRKNTEYYILVYENITEESRASIIFEVKCTQYDEATETIGKFFKSDIVNKRLAIAHHAVDFYRFGIKSYWRISHTNFYDWQRAITRLNYR